MSNTFLRPFHIHSFFYSLSYHYEVGSIHFTDDKNLPQVSRPVSHSGREENVMYEGDGTSSHSLENTYAPIFNDWRLSQRFKRKNQENRVQWKQRGERGSGRRRQWTMKMLQEN